MKSDREFIEGIYEKAAVIQKNMSVAQATDLSLAKRKKKMPAKIIFPVAAAAICCMVIAGRMYIFKGVFNKNSQQQELTRTAGDSNVGIGLLSLRDVNIEFEISVTVKNIVFDEDTVDIECIAIEDVGGRVSKGEELVLCMTRAEYEKYYPEGMEVEKDYTFVVYEIKTGLRILPSIK